MADWHVEIATGFSPWDPPSPTANAMKWAVEKINAYQPSDPSGIYALVSQGLWGEFNIYLCVRADMAGTVWEPSGKVSPHPVGKTVTDLLIPGNWAMLGFYGGNHKTNSGRTPHPDTLMGVKCPGLRAPVGEPHKWEYDSRRNAHAWVADWLNLYRPGDASGVVGMMSQLGSGKYDLHVWCRPGTTIKNGWRRADIDWGKGDMKLELQKRLVHRDRRWIGLAFYDGVEGDRLFAVESE